MTFEYVNELTGQYTKITHVALSEFRKVEVEQHGLGSMFDVLRILKNVKGFASRLASRGSARLNPEPLNGPIAVD
jgi:hypothetical protein